MEPPQFFWGGVGWLENHLKFFGVGWFWRRTRKWWGGAEVGWLGWGDLQPWFGHRVRKLTSWVTHEYVSEYSEWLNYSYSRLFTDHNAHATHTHEILRDELLTLLMLTLFENCSTHAHSYSLTAFFEWTHDFSLMLWAWVSIKIHGAFGIAIYINRKANVSSW